MFSKTLTPEIHSPPRLDAIFMYDFRLRLVLSLAPYITGAQTADGRTCSDPPQIEDLRTVYDEKVVVFPAVAGRSAVHGLTINPST